MGSRWFKRFINDRYYDISNNTWTSFTSSGNTVGSRMGMTGQIMVLNYMLLVETQMVRWRQ